MGKILVLISVVVVAFMAVDSSFAIPPGKVVEFDGKGAGRVVFDGKVHAEKGCTCADCHQSGLFKTEAGNETMTMKSMEEGRGCGACHNGVKAFSVMDRAFCKSCHNE